MFMVVSFPWPVPSANVALTGIRRQPVRPHTTTRATALTQHDLKLLDRTPLAAQTR
jgi:hypothetical protein